MSLIRTKEDYAKYINRISVIPYGLYGPTPDELIQNMVNQIDIDWKNPNLKILDPGFGFGGFLFFTYLKLKEHHSDEHILNNMIYGIEIEPFRFTLVKEKFKIKNLFNDSYTNPSSELKSILNMKFDVILGNPPYQDAKNKNKSHPLWSRFIENSFDFLKKDATLMFITPDSWRTTNSNALPYFNSNVVTYIDFDIQTHFKGVGSTFCFFIIKNQKSNNKTKTKVKYQNKLQDINLYNIKVLPKLELYGFVKKMLNYSKKLDVVSIGAPFRSDTISNVSKKKDSEFKNELYHINSENYFSKLKHPYQSNKKVILNKTGNWKPFYDGGNIGFTHINLAILVNSESDGKFYESYLNSKIIKTFIYALNVFGARDKFTMESIPMPNITTNVFSDDYLYDMFGLNDEEKQFIESFIND